jgi:hypothetical protein
MMPSGHEKSPDYGSPDWTKWAAWLMAGIGIVLLVSVTFWML